VGTRQHPVTMAPGDFIYCAKDGYFCAGLHSLNMDNFVQACIH
jgi:hypothetical protein